MVASTASGHYGRYAPINQAVRRGPVTEEETMTAWSASPPRKAALAGFVISALVAMSFLGGAST
ncbi:MAG TPA: hypothetical protein VGW38_21665, partial [Chloroflexota bacterium]|nr:hypothetical protein [Chloroflexota bacterium]